MHSKETIALLLAGGQGSRLGVLTKTVAKPAVLYGGKYRIIDFSLSNCVNSGVDTVGVLTQYQPLRLNAHIGIGKAWDMDRIHGGLTNLSPYLKAEEGDWYKGTANAVYQNIEYIDSYSPEYVLILSGDHIYKMDYSQMIEFHKSKNAEVTISVMDVPLEEASRYGLMNTRENGEIYGFEEKPENPKSTLASMGVYVFSWKALREYLILDEEDPNSKNDFGKNIIPKMLDAGKKAYAYPFEGYWRDVGTVQAYWDSNMDLISKTPEFDLFNPKWKIYTPNPLKAANYISHTGSVKKSLICEGCMIDGTVINSIISPGVYIEEGALVEDSIIMPNTIVGKDSIIKKSIISEKVNIGRNVIIGEGLDVENQDNPSVYNSGISVIGEEAIIPDKTTIGKNVMIDAGVKAEDFLSPEIESGKSVYKGGI